MEQLQVDRLNTLADFLDSLDPKRFDYLVFADNKDYTSHTAIYQEDTNILVNECGSVGCALGWATTIPEFQALGLNMRDFSPSYQCYNGFSAGMAFFGLASNEALFLFNSGNRMLGWESPIETATPKEVAAHIRMFLAAKGY